MDSVLVLGGVSYDTLIALEQLPLPLSATVFSSGYRETIGSTGAGKALNLNRLGVEVKLHALIGEDSAGDAIRAYLAAENLHFVYDIDPKGTERHTNLTDKAGGRISIYTHYATFEPQIDRVRIEELIARSDHVVLNINNYCRHLIPFIRQQQKPIWCDIHDYDGHSAYHQDFIAAANYLFCNDEALPDQRAFMHDMIARGKRLVVCTHGKAGSTTLTADGRCLHTPAVLTYPFVDSNGAGDSFFAGVLYGHLQGCSIEEALRCGAIVAGLCVGSSEVFDVTLSANKADPGGPRDRPRFLERSA